MAEPITICDQVFFSERNSGRANHDRAGCPRTLRVFLSGRVIRPLTVRSSNFFVYAISIMLRLCRRP